MSELKKHPWLPIQYEKPDPDFPVDEGVGFLRVQLPPWMCNRFGIPQDHVFDWGGFYTEFGLLWVGSIKMVQYDDYLDDPVVFEHCYKITALCSFNNWVPASEEDMKPFKS